MSNNWSEVCISDKTGKKSFVCIASPMSTHSEIKNLTHHMNNAKKNPSQYKFLDVASMFIMVDSQPNMTDDELLAALGA